MTLAKNFRILLVICALLLTSAQTAYAADRYIAVKPGESVEVSNGDGTSAHFVLDTLVTAQSEFYIDADWWRMVYEAVRQEVKRLTPIRYNERNEDIIVLLHNRPMDHERIVSLRFKLEDGRIVPTGKLSEEQALRRASHMFVEPGNQQEYMVKGWFYWVQNEEFDLMALDCRDSGETTIHELAHAFTIFETSTEERERIAEMVLESLGKNDSFMSLMSTSSLTPHLTAPTCVDLEDFLKPAPPQEQPSAD